MGLLRTEKITRRSVIFIIRQIIAKVSCSYQKVRNIRKFWYRLMILTVFLLLVSLMSAVLCLSASLWYNTTHTFNLICLNNRCFISIQTLGLI